MAILKAITKEGFKNFLNELEIVYCSITPEKGKIYYDYFKNGTKINDEMLNKVKRRIYGSKKNNFFPTIAEISDVLLEILEEERPQCMHCGVKMPDKALEERRCFSCGRAIEENE